MRHVLAVAALVASVSSAGAQCLVASGEARVTAAAATTLTLDDGRRVKLADVRPAGPLAAAWLGRLVGSRVKIVAGGTDRWGRVVGDVVPLEPRDAALKDTDRGLVVAMLASGVALVDPVDMSAPCLAELFGAERTAEANRRGVWQEPPVVSAAAEGLAQGSGRFVLVDGTVASVGETKQSLYLDFGTSWRTDFTVMIRRRDASEWGLDVNALLQKPIRVRGVLEAWNGGLIRLEHPAQIERR